MSKRLNRDDIDRWHDYNLHLPSRTIYIGSEATAILPDVDESGTDALMSERAVKNLFILNSISQDPIKIIMNNPGGDWYHGMAIYDAIKQSKAMITMEVSGNASSMGSIILQAADERVMHPHAVMLLHYGSLATDGHVKDVYRTTDEYKRYDAIMEDIYLEQIKRKHPKYTRKQLQDKIRHDCYLSAQEALDLGLIDRVAVFTV